MTRCRMRAAVGALWLAIAVYAALTTPAEGAMLARTAIVIGNQRYQQSRMLRTPTNDATEIARSLEALGYTVTLLTDGTRAQMLEVMATATPRLHMPHESVVFFYAGHGVQIRGVNYLVPVDFVNTGRASPLESLVSVEDLLQPLFQLDASVTKVILLDACRNDPFTQHLGTGPGLAEPSFAPTNVLIGYATQPGNFAEDGDWKHSPYTKALLRELGRVGQTLDETMTQVRNFVDQMTDGDQVPWLSKSMPANFFFRPPVIATLTLGDVDDAGIVTMNGVEVLSSSRRAPATVRLSPGRNEIAVVVYNQKTCTMNNCWLGKAEGWHYSLSMGFAADALLSSDVTQDAACHLAGTTLHMQAAEDEPPKDGPRHGGLFTASTAVLEVEEYTGRVRLVSADCQFWRH